ncbi:hypothetical protein Pint_14890 [Pistacia integerrima]|uniref:Uncharacterized protein n=1 Tax=Pistacia integerrima TaxID=434235 RepID=A0ACC0ZAD4_9ROSI|nr:hypothetical protein Pint_14890 [Pistacia integerrima]
MGMPQSPTTTPHLYPQALQLKLYQAFIFSIPILFSIILFLLFYLFYLKRRASSLSSAPILPTSSNQASPFIHDHLPCQMGWDGEIQGKLPIILFDEELRNRDSQPQIKTHSSNLPKAMHSYKPPVPGWCCVCLGEFEMKEELLQVPLCKHVFHIECIHHWLHSNTTCPLCRCSVIPVTKLSNPATPSESESQQREGANSNDNQPNIQSEQRQQQQQQQQLDGDDGSSDIANACRDQLVIRIEGSSSASTSLNSSGRLSE